jgi:hypothetical protein
VHFNKGTVYRYLEDYQNAVIELQRADELDKELDASCQVRQMLKLVHEMHSMILRKCNIKPQRLAAVLAALPAMTEPITVAGCEYVDCHVDKLSEAWNAGKMLTVLIVAIPYTERPIHLVVADREGTCFAMSIYNMHEGKLKPGDFITALSPYLRICTLPASVFEGVGIQLRPRKQPEAAAGGATRTRPPELRGASSCAGAEAGCKNDAGADGVERELAEGSGDGDSEVDEGVDGACSYRYSITIQTRSHARSLSLTHSRARSLSHEVVNRAQMVPVLTGTPCPTANALTPTCRK